MYQVDALSLACKHANSCQVPLTQTSAEVDGIVVNFTGFLFINDWIGQINIVIVRCCYLVSYNEYSVSS